jgi:hypothetical protein
MLLQIPEPPSSKIKRVVGGTVEVINGCTFTVKNMTLIPSSNDMYWYAIPLVKPPDDEPQTARAVPARLGNYIGNVITFTLDPTISLNDTAVLMIYSEPDFRPVAAFGVKAKVKDYLSIDNEKANLKWDPTDVMNTAPHPFSSSSSSYLALALFMGMALWMT